MSVVLDGLFETCFRHLGIDVLYQRLQQDPIAVRLLEKLPDLTYTAGGAHFTETVLTGELLCEDIADPHIGDKLIIGDQTYTIFQEPLRDASQRVWRIQAMVRGLNA